MNNEQLIEGLKQNTRGFFALSKEERECLEGHREWVEYRGSEAWVSKDRFSKSHELYEGSIYRLSPQAPAFQPEEKRGEWVEYKIDSDGVKYYIKRFGPNNERLLLSTLPQVVGFCSILWAGTESGFDMWGPYQPNLTTDKPATPVKARFWVEGE